MCTLMERWWTTSSRLICFYFSKIRRREKNDKILFLNSIEIRSTNTEQNELMGFILNRRNIERSCWCTRTTQYTPKWKESCANKSLCAIQGRPFFLVALSFSFHSQPPIHTFIQFIACKAFRGVSHAMNVMCLAHNALNSRVSYVI